MPTFWSLQAESWRLVGRKIRGAWNRRTRTGFWVTLAAVVVVVAAVPAGIVYLTGRNAIVITSQKDNDQVHRCIPTLGGTGKLASGHALWISVQFRDPQGNSRVLFSRRAKMSNGKWHADRIDVGGANQALNSYTIAAVDVDQSTDKALNSTLVDMSFSDAKTEKPGQDLWRISYQGYPTGARPVADVNVTRDRDDQSSCNEIRDKQ
ncbi:hypothetical protein ACIRH0_04260 [Streptomyces sp. NPDC093675]|uniref:hypothetical protein n=1 Tax=Streptomyces sp. NPDC093675 TaxID=3366049 RepID=UPI00382D30E3